MEKLKKFQTIPFMDIATEGEDANWGRIGKSTIFDLSVNANTVTNDYIEDENPTDEVTYYKPTLPQELAAYKGDPAFDYLYDMFYNLPVGTKTQRNVLIVFAGNIGTAEAPKFKAWKSLATIVLKNFNTVDEKISFDINFGGSIEKGEATVTEGVPTFTAVKAQD